MSTNRGKIIQLHGKKIIISNTNVHTILNSVDYQEPSQVNDRCSLTGDTEIVTSDTYKDMRNTTFAGVNMPAVHRVKRVSSHIIQVDNCIPSTLQCIPQPSNSKIKKFSTLHVAALDAIESESIYMKSNSIQSQSSQVIANIPVKITGLGPSTVLVSEYLANDNEIKDSTYEVKQTHKRKVESNELTKITRKKRVKKVKADYEKPQIDNNTDAIYTDTISQPFKRPRFDLADMSIDMCRICTRKETLLSIFDATQTPSIIERIKCIATVQIYTDDGLPQMICRQCLHKLSVAYNFKRLCEFSDLEMRRKTTVKETQSKITDAILIANSATRIEPQIDSDISDEVVTQEYEHAIGNSDLDFQPPLANVVLDESENERTEECVTCKSKFKNTIELQKHIITAHLVVESPSEENIHLCTVCNKEFNNLHKLNAHAVYHNKVKYRCDLCPMTFWGLASYKSHQRTCHPLQCGECNIAFEYEYLLEQHTRLEHKQLDTLFKYVAPVTSTHWSDSESD